MFAINKNAERKLDGCSSIFLDSLRLFCALLVVAGHCRQILTPSWQESGIFLAGHGAVIIFFVLSGYVIAHTTSTKHRDIKAYFASRYARLYSIYVPALIVTIVCALILVNTNSSIYFQYDRGSNTARYLLTLFFCNELWFTSAAPPLNGPFWSLSFEFWYYTLFALLWFKSFNAKGVLLIILICLFVGPKILLMFPIWGMGWLAYKAKQFNLSTVVARSLSLASLIIAFITTMYLPQYPGKVGYSPLYMANGFLSDMLTGIFVATSIYLLPTNNEPAIKDSLLLRRFRYTANLTYPIYLLHFPLLVLCSSILLKQHLSLPENYFIGFFLVLCTSMLLGSFFENRKQWWYNFFRKLFFEKRIAFGY